MKHAIVSIVLTLLMGLVCLALAADQLWVEHIHAPMFTEVEIPVYMENPDTPVQSFSFHIITDPAVISYTGYNRGDLTANTQIFAVGEPVLGDIIVQGHDPMTSIPTGSCGTVVILHFSVMTGYCDLIFDSLSDDIAGFYTENGSFLACQPEWTWLSRDLPDTCEPGVPFDVTYSYQGGTAAITQTTETVPDGWVIVEPTHCDLEKATYTWGGPIFNAILIPPEDAAAGIYSISGSNISSHWCNGDVTHAITGDQTIYLEDPAVTPTPPCYHTGDVVPDNEITAGDAQLSFLIALGSHIPTWDELCAADCNSDDVVTSGDAQMIFLFTMGSCTCADPMPEPTATATGTPTPNQFS